jgi:hypothetical protein
MDQLEELAQRLAMLESGAAEQQAAQQQTQFMDKYGTKFSGDEGLGVAILAELGRRGIDTSAADEAVQDILDQIRAEATAILDKIKMDERTVSDLMDKVSTVEESVNAATGAAPGLDMPIGTGAPPPAEGPIPMGAGIDPSMPPADAGALPPDLGMPPAGGELTPPPPVEGGGAPAPTDAGAPPIPAEEPMPPAGIPSDERIKHIRSKVTTMRKAPAPVKPSAPPAWKPPAHMLNPIRSNM